MDFIAHCSERTEIGALQLVAWIGLSRSKFYSWRDRYGKANEHNALVPRDHWLEPCSGPRVRRCKAVLEVMTGAFVEGKTGKKELCQNLKQNRRRLHGRKTNCAISLRPMTCTSHRSVR